MKMQRTARATAAEGAAAAVRTLEIVDGPAAQPPTTASPFFGIPEQEFTAHVREAVRRLVGETDALRRELRHTQLRLLEAEHSADRDHLLPLLNRRAFVRELTRAIGLTARYSTHSSLIYFDLDEFKRVNDSFGHAAGDAVLTHFADILLAHVRDSDIVARLGGDEFGVILAHNDQSQAEAKAARREPHQCWRC